MAKLKTKKKVLFVPLSQDDFLPGNHGASYLNEYIWLLIENLNVIKKLLSTHKRKVNKVRK